MPEQMGRAGVGWSAIGVCLPERGSQPPGYVGSVFICLLSGASTENNTENHIFNDWNMQFSGFEEITNAIASFLLQKVKTCHSMPAVRIKAS